MAIDHSKDTLILHAIHRILLKEWDPLGIRRVHAMQDEYEDYLPRIFELFKKKATESEFFEYLWFIETKVMEHKGNREHTLKVAQSLKNIQV